MRTIHVDLRFTQPVLGTASGDPRIHERYIASKGPDAATLREEVAALGAEAVEERQMTVFPKLPDETPFLWNYQVKGFLKEAASCMGKADGSKTGPVAWGIKSTIDNLVFISQRTVPLAVPEGEPIRVLQRPLRAETAQGPRVALASSEMLPAGTTASFDVTLLAERTKKTSTRPSVSFVEMLCEWLSYGLLKGIGQWRNGSYGTFRCRVTDEEGKVLLDNMA